MLRKVLLQQRHWVHAVRRGRLRRTVGGAGGGVRHPPLTAGQTRVASQRTVRFCTSKTASPIAIRRPTHSNSAKGAAPSISRLGLRRQ